MTSTSAYTTILNLPVITNLPGDASVWVVSGGTDYRASINQLQTPVTFASSQLAAMPAYTIIGNITAASANPTNNTLTQTFDAQYGTTQNLFLTRGATGWAPRALIGNDLPTPSTNSAGGIFASSAAPAKFATGLNALGQLQYNFVSVDGGTVVFVSTGSGQPPNKTLIGQVSGYNVLYNQTGNLAFQIGSTANGDPIIYIKSDNGVVYTNGNATQTFGLLYSGGLQLNTSAAFTTLLQISTNSSNVAVFPGAGGTYTVAGSCVALKGTGSSNFTQNGVVFGNGTNALTATTAGAAGQLLLGQSSAPSFQTMSGAATISSAGVVTLVSSIVEQGMTLLNVITANASVASDTTSFTATYDDYLVTFDNITPATSGSGGQTALLQVHSGGAFQNTNYLNSAGGVTSGVDVTIGGNNIANTYGFSMPVTFHNVNSASAVKFLTGIGTYVSNVGTAGIATARGFWNGGTGAVDGFTIFFSSGNIGSGTIKVYGMKKAL